MIYGILGVEWSLVMKKLTHDEKLDYLVGELCDEFVQKKSMRIEKDDRRTLIRALMNIRMPRTMSEDFLQVQDEFLREEAEEKGIVRLEDIPTISEQYGLENAYSDKISI